MAKADAAAAAAAAAAVEGAQGDAALADGGSAGAGGGGGEGVDLAATSTVNGNTVQVELDPSSMAGVTTLRPPSADENVLETLVYALSRQSAPVFSTTVSI